MSDLILCHGCGHDIDDHGEKHDAEYGIVPVCFRLVLGDETPCCCRAKPSDIALAAVEAAKPRTLTADDPEPPFGSVVVDRDGKAWIRTSGRWMGPGRVRWRREFDQPVTLIHEGTGDG